MWPFYTGLRFLLGNIARPTNYQIVIKDDDSFNNWVHVISDPVVVRNYGGDIEQQIRSTNHSIILHLRQYHGLTLTINDDHLVLSKNQVNVLIHATTETLHYYGARACWVQFFGMKWILPEVESIIMDHLIQRYIDIIDVHVVHGRNQFDMDTLYHDLKNVIIFKLISKQTQNQDFRLNGV